MDDKVMLNEEALKLINGGVLLEGWDSTLLAMMSLYKGKFGDNGKQMVTDLFTKHGVGSDGPLEEADIPVILAFIDNNWDGVEPRQLP